VYPGERVVVVDWHPVPRPLEDVCMADARRFQGARGARTCGRPW
jgi:hypothetical protein